MNSTKKAVVEDIVESGKKIKVRFNTPLKNRNITSDKYKEAYKAYFSDVIKDHGKPMAFPNELQMIMFKVEEMYGEPLFFVRDIEYLMDAEDAEYYASLYRTVPIKEPFHLKNAARDLPKYLEQFYLAEIIND